jgi:hypothetical protein
MTQGFAAWRSAGPSPRSNKSEVTMQPLRPIDYFFAAAFGITLGCLIAAFI